jgi:hypothetical protein
MSLGLKGAAMAVPAYYSVQLLVAAMAARRTIREAFEEQPMAYAAQ